MKNLLFLGALIAGSAWTLQGSAVGHGGTYRGPGDTVPPGGGGSSGGPAPVTPGPTGPAAPGPSTPGTPAPVTPGAPGAAPGATNNAPTTAAAELAPDLTVWDFWWGFNKEPYLNLKSKIHETGTVTSSDDFFLGFGEKGDAKDSLRPSQEEIRNKVVPALKKVLEEERANDILDGSLIALAKIGDISTESGVSEFEQIISKFLDDSAQQVAETAAIALGILANEKSIPTLVSLLNDTPEGRRLTGKTNEVPFRTRAFAAYGLGLIANATSDSEIRKNIAETLVDILNQPNFARRDIKVAAMTALGLCEIESNPEATVEAGEEESYRKWVISREAQLEFLLDYFDPSKQQANASTRHWQVRAHAPTTMARLINGVSEEYRVRVAEALMGGVAKHSKETKEVMMGCALALGQIGDASNDGKSDIDTKIRAELARLIQDGEPQVRRFSLISLAQIAGRPGAGENPTDGVDDVRKILETTLARGKTQLKPWAGLAIGVMCDAMTKSNQIAPEGSLKALTDTAGDCKRPSEIGAYALGLGVAKYQPAREAINDRMDHFEVYDAKGYCAVALGLIGDRSDIEPIQEIVQTSRYKPELLREAAIALGLLGDKNLVDDLVKMLSEAKGLATQAALSSALGAIGDSRSIDPLVEMLLNDQLTDTARGFSAAALGIVCDKEPYPWNSKISVNINYRANTVTLTGEGGTGILDLL